MGLLERFKEAQAAAAAAAGDSAAPHVAGGRGLQGMAMMQWQGALSHVALLGRSDVTPT